MVHDQPTGNLPGAQSNPDSTAVAAGDVTVVKSQQPARSRKVHVNVADSAGHVSLDQVERANMVVVLNNALAGVHETFGGVLVQNVRLGDGPCVMIKLPQGISYCGRCHRLRLQERMVNGLCDTCAA